MTWKVVPSARPCLDIELGLFGGTGRWQTKSSSRTAGNGMPTSTAPNPRILLMR
ncbi:hypothetical protein BC826DRAFT_1019306 [Russula brevipes]|nr:hypothetical protein BC826DRAFT_1019306 [Russula brevipes]